MAGRQRRVIRFVLMLSIAAIPPGISGETAGPGSERVSGEPVVIEFPLRGEWLAPHTPGSRIPSHGTDRLGERYAFDFVQVDWERKGRPFYRASFLRYLVCGVPLAQCYGWGRAVHAPCAGEIVEAVDGWRERPRAHPVSDLFVALRNALTYRAEKDGLQPVAGNYIIMKCREHVYAAFAHLQRGSIAVRPGQIVQRGQVLGKVGHSGNSTAPHLHFQLMDRSNLLSAKGIPCVFACYDLYKNGKWQTVSEQVPSDTDRIRFNG